MPCKRKKENGRQNITRLNKGSCFTAGHLSEHLAVQRKGYKTPLGHFGQVCIHTRAKFNKSKSWCYVVTKFHEKTKTDVV